MASNPREAYGRTLAELARQDVRIWALDADLSRSTMSVYIEQEFPDRFVECGIAEANMAGIAAGLALAGKIPFASTFAVFMTGRAFDQIRQSVCIPKLNVKFCGSSAGLTDYSDGSTHQTVEDIALMRALPNMTVLSPGDAPQAAACVKAAAALDGPVYIRIPRSDLDDLPECGPFAVGKLYPLTEGSDITIVATGVMVSRALIAAQALKARGVSALVVNAPTIKPLDEAALLALAKKTGKVLTYEDHSVIGGLGSAVAEALATSGVPVHRMGILDRFGMSSNSETALIEQFHLGAKDIEDKVLGILKS